MVVGGTAGIDVAAGEAVIDAHGAVQEESIISSK
jgi:hypothetical protein